MLFLCERTAHRCILIKRIIHHQQQQQFVFLYLQGAEINRTLQSPANSFSPHPGWAMDMIRGRAPHVSVSLNGVIPINIITYDISAILLTGLGDTLFHYRNR